MERRDFFRAFFISIMVFSFFTSGRSPVHVEQAKADDSDWSWMTPIEVVGACNSDNTINAIDEDLETQWGHSPTVSCAHHIEFDMGALKCIHKIRLYWADAYQFWGAIYVTNDTENWGSPIGYIYAPGSQTWKNSTSFVKMGRYLKIKSATTSNPERFAEIDVLVRDVTAMIYPPTVGQFETSKTYVYHDEYVTASMVVNDREGRDTLVNAHMELTGNVKLKWTNDDFNTFSELQDPNNLVTLVPSQCSYESLNSTAYRVNFYMKINGGYRGGPKRVTYAYALDDDELSTNVYYPQSPYEQLFFIMELDEATGYFISDIYACKDASVYIHEGTVNLPDINVKGHVIDWAIHKRAFVGWNWLGLMPGGHYVHNAEMRLWCYARNQDPMVRITRIHNAWSEDGICWNNQPGLTGDYITYHFDDDLIDYWWVLNVTSIYNGTDFFEVKLRTDGYNGDDNDHQRYFTPRESNDYDEMPTLRLLWSYSSEDPEEPEEPEPCVSVVPWWAPFGLKIMAWILPLIIIGYTMSNVHDMRSGLTVAIACLAAPIMLWSLWYFGVKLEDFLC